MRLVISFEVYDGEESIGVVREVSDGDRPWSATMPDVGAIGRFPSRRDAINAIKRRRWERAAAEAGDLPYPSFGPEARILEIIDRAVGEDVRSVKQLRFDPFDSGAIRELIDIWRSRRRAAPGVTEVLSGAEVFESMVARTRAALTFEGLRRANMQRLPMFKDGQGRVNHTKADGSDWSPAQWLQAVVGELGEYANLRKKVERGDLTMDQAHERLSSELADVVIYLDLLAAQLCIDLGVAITTTWNAKSEKLDIPLRIEGDDCRFTPPNCSVQGKP
jgi:NTP pyrophosphatase (non-canonical NTP hydrolase)